MQPIKKEGPKGPQKLSSVKSLNIQKPPPIPGIFTFATIRNYLPYKIQCSKTVKNVLND